MADYLCSQIETLNWFEIDWYPLFGPFALLGISISLASEVKCPNPSKLVPLNLIWLSASEASLVYQIRKLLLHKFLDFLNGFLEPIFRDAGDMQV